MRLTGGRNMQKRKIAIIGASCVAAATLIVGSALALFTDETESDAAAKAGTVKIDVSPITFTNAGNVNPGDNDPTISPDAHSGTTHDVKYVVSNLGNKSVKTRQTIILTCDEQEVLRSYSTQDISLFIIEMPSYRIKPIFPLKASHIQTYLNLTVMLISLKRHILRRLNTLIFQTLLRGSAQMLKKKTDLVLLLRRTIRLTHQ